MFILPIKSRIQILQERESPEFFIKTGSMILLYIPTPQRNIDYNSRVTDFVRLLAVVSKKISKKAVVRNPATYAESHTIILSSPSAEHCSQEREH